MFGASNLLLVKGTYYARAAVPKALRDARIAAGLHHAAEQRRSLRTKDRRAAVKLLPHVLIEMRSDWEQELASRSAVRESIPGETMPTHRSPVSMDEILTAARAELAAVIAQDEARRHSPSASGDTKIDLERAQRRQLESVADAAKTSPATLRILRRIEKRLGITLDESGPIYPAARMLAGRAAVELTRVLAARDRGDFAPVAGDPAFHGVLPGIDQPLVPSGRQHSSAPAKGCSTILDAFEAYITEVAPTLSPEQPTQKRAALRDFMECIHPQIDVSAVNNESFRVFKKALLSKPRNPRKQASLKGLTLPQMLEANEVLKLPTITRKTAETALASLRAFASWLHNEGHIDEPVTVGGFKVGREHRVQRPPYSDAELKQIFDMPVFRGHSEDRRTRPGPIIIRDHQFWLPLITLFTGCRLGEIAQLEVGDVVQVSGHWVFKIQLEGTTSKRLKSRASRRVIPVHSELQRLGFIEYKLQQEATGSAQLFPLLKPGKSTGRLSERLGRVLSDYAKRCGVGGVNYYRFRHTITDAFRRADYQNLDIAPLLGHSTDRLQTAAYGALDPLTLASRVKAIERVVYPSLDFSALHIGSPKT